MSPSSEAHAPSARLSSIPKATDVRPRTHPLYLASREVGEHINQLKLAYAAGITPITIRKRSVEISSILNSAKEAKSFLEELRNEEKETEVEVGSQPVVAAPEDLEIQV